MVTDAFGNPVGSAVATFRAPIGGASAILSSGGSATTDAAGHASVTAVANGLVGGPYAVTATVGTLPPASFTLTNQADSLVAIPALDGMGLIGFALLLAAVGAASMRGAFKA